MFGANITTCVWGGLHVLILSETIPPGHSRLTVLNTNHVQLDLTRHMDPNHPYYVLNNPQCILHVSKVETYICKNSDTTDA